MRRSIKRETRIKKMLKYLVTHGEPVKVSQLKEDLKIPASTLYNLLGLLKSEGLVLHNNQGYITLARGLASQLIKDLLITERSNPARIHAVEGVVKVKISEKKLAEVLNTMKENFKLKLTKEHVSVFEGRFRETLVVITLTYYPERKNKKLINLAIKINLKKDFTGESVYHEGFYPLKLILADFMIYLVDLLKLEHVRTLEGYVCKAEVAYLSQFFRKKWTGRPFKLSYKEFAQRKEFTFIKKIWVDYSLGVPEIEVLVQLKFSEINKSLLLLHSFFFALDHLIAIHLGRIDEKELKNMILYALYSATKLVEFLKPVILRCGEFQITLQTSNSPVRST